jgi:hypothetical protein
MTFYNEGIETELKDPSWGALGVTGNLTAGKPVGVYSWDTNQFDSTHPNKLPFKGEPTTWRVPVFADSQPAGIISLARIDGNLTWVGFDNGWAEAAMLQSMPPSSYYVSDGREGLDEITAAYQVRQLKFGTSYNKHTLTANDYATGTTTDFQNAILGMIAQEKKISEEAGGQSVYGASVIYFDDYYDSPERQQLGQQANEKIQAERETQASVATVSHSSSMPTWQGIIIAIASTIVLVGIGLGLSMLSSRKQNSRKSRD